MPEENEDDILAVTESLSEDLAAAEAEEEGAPEEAPEEETEEEGAPEEETEASEEEEEETPAEEDESEEAERPEGQEKKHTDDTKPPINREGDEDAEEEPEESEEEVAPEEESDADAEETNERIAALQAEVAKISEENTKLRAALKRGLAERVVDTRIVLGLSEKENRDELLTEYTSRTASSLADSLRDLAEMKPRPETNLESLEITPTVGAVGDDGERVVTTEGEEEEQEAADPAEAFEDTLVDALMWRRKIS